ncbi:VanZ like family protein [Rubripirellula obstinata]|uniref:VanZ like family protein n=1 Tax=Rubripirellula obstinata TaxID=406547 RepID=A0A5B1CJ26_9BACT|nr:VanZ family protein [Rubripirellula obstinata]KAA1259443.1 VanZ like family protein [Rubripirellula obstinata]
MRPVTRFNVFGIRLAILCLAVYWIAIFTGTHLPSVMDFSPKMHDKSKHFLAFFGLAILLCYVTNSRNYVKRFGIIAIVCLIYAAVDEITQSLVPGRVPDYQDFIADAFGVAAAIGTYYALKLVSETRRIETLAG